MLPTLFIGVGGRGKRIAVRARDLARELASGDCFPVRVAVIGAGDTESADEDYSIQANDLLNEPGANPFAPLIERMTADPQDAQLLAAAPAWDIQAVADAADPTMQEVGLRAIAAAHRAVAGRVAGTTVHTVLYLCIPPGETAAGAEIRKMLEAVADQLANGNGELSQVFLISGAAPEVQLTPADTDEQCAFAMALRAADPVGDALRDLQPSYGADAAERMGSFGLSTLELHPQELAERMALPAAERIVKEGLNAPCLRPDDIEEAAEAALSALPLRLESFPAVRDRLRHYTVAGRRHDVLEDVRVPHFMFELVPRTRRHVLLANYALYFRRERLDIALTRIARNIETLLAETGESIRGAVDRVVRGGRDPSNAFKLLERLHAQAVEARKHLIADRSRTAQPQAKNFPLQKLLQQLAEASASEPSLVAMLARAAVASAGVATALLSLLRTGWLLHVSLTGPDAAGLWLAAFLVPFVVGAALAWRHAHRARSLTDMLTEQCQQAIAAEARERILAAVEDGLSRVVDLALFLTASPDELRSLKADYTGPNEWREVQAFLDRLRNELPAALPQPQPALRAAWRVNVEQHAVRDPEYHYADTPGFNNWAGEAEALIVTRGLFEDWREASASELAKEIVDYTLNERMKHVLSLTLEDFYKEWISGAQQEDATLTNLYNTLFRLAGPSVRTIQTERETRAHLIILAGPGGSNGPLAAAMRARAGVPDTVAHCSNCRLVLVRLFNGIKPQDLAAWTFWNAANSKGRNEE